MATFSKIRLSGGTDGKNIKVAATATPGTLVHTAHATALDELWLNACIPGATARELTVEYGEATNPDGLTRITVPAVSGWIPVIEGHIITNSLVVRVFCAAAANEVIVNGYVNRIV